MKKIYKILSIMLVLTFLATGTIVLGQDSQKIKVESIVRDLNGKPLANATIATEDGTIETTSDEEGYFSLEVPQNATLVVSHDNFESNAVSAIEAMRGVIMEPSRLKTMVNLPFGQKTERNTLGAITVITPDDVAGNNSLQLVEDVLRDRVPGLRGTGNIRGIGGALTVVDGIPRPIFNLNMEEVESITILKDVHAAILYGSEAQNGVILVQTKRGRPFQNKVNVFAETGISSVRQMPEYLGSADYMQLRNEALLNDGNMPAYSDSVINLYAGAGNPYRYPNVDYYSDEFLNSSTRFNRVVSEFSGGNENTKYYANVGWTNNGKLYALGEGQNAATNRFNVRANSDFRINNFISGHLDGIFIFNVDSEPVGNFWQDAATIHPYFFSPLIPRSLVNDEGILNTAQFLNNEYLIGGTNQYQQTVYGNMFFGGKSQNIYRYMQFNNGLKFDLNNVIKGLTFNTNLSFDLYNRYTQINENEYAVYNPQWVTTASLQDSIASLNKIGRDLKTGNQRLTDEFFYRRYGVFTTLDYNRVFGKHGIEATLLGYYNRQDNEGDVISNKQAHAGLRVAYTFDNKYLVDFSGTLTNSIRLPKGEKLGLSPSLALGWILSEEDFLSGSGIINFLKLKASAGILKTDMGMGYYLYNSTFNRGGSISWNDRQMFNVPVWLTRANNPNMSFINVKNINVGLEGFLLNNTLGFDFNFFNTVRSGELTQRSIYPAYLGDNIPFENYGAVSYTGAELGLTYNQKVTEDLSFDFGINMLVQNSKVLERDEQWEFDYQYREGKPNDVIFGYESLGFFADSTDILNSPSQLALGTIRPGDIKYKDQNGDGIIDQNDAVEIGNWSPRLSYGLSLGINYKNLSLFAIGGGQMGSDMTLDGSYFMMDGNDKYSVEALNRWTPETANTATLPRLSSGANTNSYRTSTFWLQSANAFSLNHVQLTYTFNDTFLNNLKIMKGASIYLRGQDLLLMGNQAERRLINVFGPPNMSRYALGVRMNF